MTDEKDVGRRIRRFEELEIEIPERPGPKILGLTPLIGCVRRSFGLPVLRDYLPTLIEIEPPLIFRKRRY
ncbi:MAG TPA: hypothetical protein ENF26_01020 [Methanomicrobia archaeon]|nr:hypothetical protein [Methanomicrobia archaeon]HEX58713.1 hypothetical protein [Methanomicrobia archaeon]